MKVVFLNRFFAPDHSATSQILSDVAFSLAAGGRCICVITTRQRYDAPESRLPSQEMLKSVEVHRVWTSRFGRQALAGRAIDYLTFYSSASWRLFRLARHGDVIVAKTDPPMLSVIAAPIAAIRGAYLVNWLQDIFPEVAEVLGVGSGRLSRAGFSVLRSLRDRSLKSAQTNIVLGDRMAARLQELGVPPSCIHVIPNFADGAGIKPIAYETNNLRREWGLKGKFVVGYSGNLGRAHEYETMLDAIARTETATADSAPIVWLFIGGGALYDAFRKEVIERGLKSVRFEPYQPRERLSESLSAADVHLVSLRPELEGLVVPSKVYGIMAAGRPTIFIGAKDGEIAQLIEKHDCGLTVQENDSSGLARVVLDLSSRPERLAEMGSNAREAFEKEFDKPIAVERWKSLLEKVGASPS